MTMPDPQSAAFLAWLDGWFGGLRQEPLDALIERAGGPDGVGVMIVDLLAGFCTTGPLASPRVQALAAPVARFLSTAHGRGVRRILHAADAHQPDAPEFEAFPPHCLRGSAEAAVVPELRGLSFAESIRLVSKGSINVGQEAELESLLAAHAAARCWVIVGDCTDLCVYQAAMHLKLRANARGERLEVCVPADLVQTYDLPIAAAEGIGALPHPGDLMHRLFLYHLALNGVRVVRALSA